MTWKWGGGKPGGTVAEVKEHGELVIQSKKGNRIKKNADPENPAVHISRPGNDVVKRASELADVKHPETETEINETNEAQDDGDDGAAPTTTEARDMEEDEAGHRHEEVKEGADREGGVDGDDEVDDPATTRPKGIDTKKPEAAKKAGEKRTRQDTVDAAAAEGGEEATDNKPNGNAEAADGDHGNKTKKAKTTVARKSSGKGGINIKRAAATTMATTKAKNGDGHAPKTAVARKASGKGGIKIKRAAATTMATTKAKNDDGHAPKTAAGGMAGEATNTTTNTSTAKSAAAAAVSADKPSKPKKVPRSAVNGDNIGSRTRSKTTKA